MIDIERRRHNRFLQGLRTGVLISGVLWVGIGYLLSSSTVVFLVIVALVSVLSLLLLRGPFPLALPRGTSAPENIFFFEQGGASGEGRERVPSKDSSVDLSGCSGEPAGVRSDMEPRCHGDSDSSLCPHLHTWVVYVDSDDCHNRRVERCFDCQEELDP